MLRRIRLNWVIGVGIVLGCCWIVCVRCQGPFLEYSDVQAVAPDVSVKAYLTIDSSSQGNKVTGYNALRFEAAAWQAKPSQPISRTAGVFTGLVWRDKRHLYVFGQGIEPALLKGGITIDYWKYGTYTIRFFDNRD
jgi:hypothetical protein